MTELAYLTDSAAAYRTSFRASVVALPPGGVVLDSTWFYAVGGGQPADHGTLLREGGGEWKVVDVARSGGSVVHRLGRARPGGPALAVGDRVEGRIDWPRRYLHMRLHSAQHLASARAFALTGLRTRKAVLGQGLARIELEGPWPARPEPGEFARELSELVAQDLPIRIEFVPRAEYDRAPSPRSALVPLAPQVDPVRLVAIGEVDRSPCGGTHLRSTSEIGVLTLGPPATLPDGGAELRFTLSELEPPTPDG